MNKYLFYIATIACILLLSSCKTSQRYLPGTPSTRELSAKMGIRVTDSDYRYLYAEAAEWLGTRHRIGGNSRRGVDCSGFVSIVYKKVYGKNLSRSSADILKNNCRKIGKSKLEEGDLVFFRTGNGKKKIPNHVGIYLKNGKFVHASTSKGVIVSSLSEPYYLRSWITGGRVK